DRRMTARTADAAPFGLTLRVFPRSKPGTRPSLLVVCDGVQVADRAWTPSLDGERRSRAPGRGPSTRPTPMPLRTAAMPYGSADAGRWPSPDPLSRCSRVTDGGHGPMSSPAASERVGEDRHARREWRQVLTTRRRSPAAPADDAPRPSARRG